MKQPLTGETPNVTADWSLRRSALVAIEYDRLIHKLKLSQRASIGIIERGLDDDRDIRIRRPLPVEMA